MLQRVEIQGFKSLADVDVHLPALTVLLGPNATGKSNFIDGLQALSLLATERTLTEALEPLRGYPVEAFTLPPGGLESLLRKPRAQFKMTADVATESGRGGRAIGRFRYSVEVGIEPATGTLAVGNEYLSRLDRRGEPRDLPRVEAWDDNLVIRPQGQGRPWHEPRGSNHTVLSDPRLSGDRYRDFDAVRNELASWRVYYLDPRVRMRDPAPPSEVMDIGTLGDTLAPFLYELKNRYPKNFTAIRRAMRAVIPSIKNVDVDLNLRRGELDLVVEQDGVPYSSRVISEGTLRVLALCALAVHPRPPALIGFEEPENGVHPRRIEMVADLLLSIVRSRSTQVVVTTHSPILGAAFLRRMRENDDPVGLFVCSLERGASKIRRYEPPPGPLLDDAEVAKALTDPQDDKVFEEMLVRGWLDG